MCFYASILTVGGVGGGRERGGGEGKVRSFTVQVAGCQCTDFLVSRLLKPSEITNQSVFS